MMFRAIFTLVADEYSYTTKETRLFIFISERQYSTFFINVLCGNKFKKSLTVRCNTVIGPHDGTEKHP